MHCYMVVSGKISKESLLNALGQNPGASVYTLATATTVWHVLHSKDLHAFHLQRVQALQVEDYSCRAVSAQWFL